MPTTDPDGAADETGTPRWVKVFALVAVLLVAVGLIVALAVGGHGPGRHTLAEWTDAGGARAR